MFAHKRLKINKNKVLFNFEESGLFKRLGVLLSKMRLGWILYEFDQKNT